MKSKIFFLAFISLIVVGALDFVAFYLHLYWSIAWFDSVVHLAGGVCVGFASIWFNFPKNSTDISKRRIFSSAIVGALVIGIAWEIFEWYFGITSLADGIHYVTDTGSDLLMDIFGSILSAWYVSRLNIVPQNLNLNSDIN